MAVAKAVNGEAQACEINLKGKRGMTMGCSQGNKNDAEERL